MGKIVNDLSLSATGDPGKPFEGVAELLALLAKQDSRVKIKWLSRILRSGSHQKDEEAAPGRSSAAG